MKKLNNKGMSLLEVVLCFAIVSAVVIGMFNVIMTYETEEVSEAIRSDIIEYKNIVTKVLQDDIFRHELYNVERTSKSVSGTRVSYRFKLYFKKPFGSYDVKTLDISTDSSNANNNYIQYQDYNGSSLQNVKYTLPQSQGSGCATITNANGDTEQNCEITSLTAVDTYLNIERNDGSNPSSEAYGYTYFKLDVTISHPSVGSDYHVSIVAPLDYRFCKI